MDVGNIRNGWKWPTRLRWCLGEDGTDEGSCPISVGSSKTGKRECSTWIGDWVLIGGDNWEDEIEEEAKTVHSWKIWIEEDKNEPYGKEAAEVREDESGKAARTVMTSNAGLTSKLDAKLVQKEKQSSFKITGLLTCCFLDTISRQMQPPCLDAYP